jgi:acetyl-CoA acetyltransferase
MGWTSEMVAETYKISRRKQDEYAFISHSRAGKVSILLYYEAMDIADACLLSFQAVAEGVFADEIIPVELRGSVISVDDTIRQGVTLEGLSALKPVFPNWGQSSTTAGNASGVGDGAALCILTTRARAEQEGMEILGKYIYSTVVGQSFAPAASLSAHMGTIFRR